MREGEGKEREQKGRGREGDKEGEREWDGEIKGGREIEEEEKRERERGEVGEGEGKGGTGCCLVPWSLHNCQSRVHVFPRAWYSCLCRFLHYDLDLPSSLLTLLNWISGSRPHSWMWISTSSSINYWMKAV